MYYIKGTIQNTKAKKTTLYMMFKVSYQSKNILAIYI